MNFKDYIKHLSIVILGILVAFWISNIGLSYQDRKTQNQVLQTILNELIENNQSIDSTLQNLDSLEQLFERVQAKDSSLATFSINYVGIDLNSIGYETAKTTGVLKDINYKLTSRIVTVYEDQLSLEVFEENFTTELLVIIKNGFGDWPQVDYALVLILNLKDNLKELKQDQDQLIRDLSDHLKIEE